MNLWPKPTNLPVFTKELLSTLIRDLEMDPSSMVTTQVALTLRAWAVNLRYVHRIVNFEYSYPEFRQEVDFGLWALFRDELSGWDRHVLTRDGKKSEFHHDNWMEEWSKVRELDQWEFGIMAVINGVTRSFGI